MVNRIQVLDCTLRDGGYCNNCLFGFENIKNILSSLVDAGVNIIECGFFSDSIKYEKDKNRFSSLGQIKDLLPKKRRYRTFVTLADYSTFDPNLLETYDGSSIDGLRIAFHKKGLVRSA